MRAFSAIAMAVLVCAGSAHAAAPRKTVHRVAPSNVTILSYTGSVGEVTFKKFADVISTNADKVIELKLTVERSRKDEERYYVGVGDNQLTISGGDPMDSSQEVVINGPVGTTVDMLKVDGFYLVKNGGMHAAGSLSWGLVPVDEAIIRLNPRIKILKKTLS